MGYSTFKSSPKEVTTSDDIGPGQIKLEHLDPALFAEIQGIKTHAHTGSGSRRIKMEYLTGSFLPSGIIIWGDAGTKKYKIQVDEDTDTLVATEI